MSFGNFEDDEGLDFGEMAMDKILEKENLDARLRKFVSLADQRAAKCFSILAALKVEELGTPKHTRAKRGMDRAHKWADYCQNRRYELRGI